MPDKASIIFDFGGVLLDWNPRHLYRRFFPGDPTAMETFLREVDFATWNLALDEGRPFAEAVADLSARFPQYAALIQAYDTNWEESILGPIQPTVDMLQPLKAAGYRLHGLSNWSAEKFVPVHKRYAFLEIFDPIIISGQVRLAKPDPRIFNLMLAKINRPAQECVFIYDSPANIQAANRLGFKTILFESAEQMRVELARLRIEFQV
jgi:2-haloacid dehalogenase